jgi:hypothetical protein
LHARLPCMVEKSRARDRYSGANRISFSAMTASFLPFDLTTRLVRYGRIAEVTIKGAQ